MTIPPFALEISVVCVGIFLMLADAFFDDLDKRSIGLAAIVGLLAIFGVTFVVGPMPPGIFPPDFYLWDSASLFFKRFLLLSTILTIALGMEYAPLFARLVPGVKAGSGLGEFLTLPIFTCAGLMWMVSAGDFIMIFVSLELVTIGFYVLIASTRRSPASLEAGVKYLILGALSTGFIVYGITWIFGITGQTALTSILSVGQVLKPEYHPALLFGLGLVLVSLGFKVAAVPFQFWVPDVYQGAPTPVTAYLSVASKAAGFVVLLRVLMTFLQIPGLAPKILAVFCWLAGLTLIFGNLAALPQRNLKRLLAYSSVAHAGYLLVGIASIMVVSDGAGTIALSVPSVAISFYLTGYLLMTFLSFFVLILVVRATGNDDIPDFNGLGRRAPVLALGLMLSMLSLAGLPFTVGFLGKFFIFEAAMASHQYVLVVIGTICVASGFYYYLKVVAAMYWQSPAEGAAPIPVTTFQKAVIGILSVSIILLGIFPQPILQMLK